MLVSVFTQAIERLKVIPGDVIFLDDVGRGDGLGDVFNLEHGGASDRETLASPHVVYTGLSKTLKSNGVKISSTYVTLVASSRTGSPSCSACSSSSACSA